jgi:hypothetical protein
MKIFLLSAMLLISFSALAQRDPYRSVYPRVSNWGNLVEVSAWNQNRIHVSCSGQIGMDFEDGTYETIYISMFVPAMGSRSQRYYPRNRDSRIRFTSNSIWCR